MRNVGTKPGSGRSDPGGGRCSCGGASRRHVRAAAGHRFGDEPRSTTCFHTCPRPHPCEPPLRLAGFALVRRNSPLCFRFLRCLVARLRARLCCHGPHRRSRYRGRVAGARGSSSRTGRDQARGSARRSARPRQLAILAGFFTTASRLIRPWPLGQTSTSGRVALPLTNPRTERTNMWRRRFGIAPGLRPMEGTTTAGCAHADPGVADPRRSSADP